MALPYRVYPFVVGEIAIAILVIGVLFISDPDRLQRIIERLREFSAWLAE
jgi:glucose uptake protein GlcU